MSLPCSLENVSIYALPSFLYKLYTSCSLLLWMIKYRRPILINDSTLLIQWTCYRTNDIHSSSCRSGTRDKVGTAHGLIASRRSNFIRFHLKIGQLVNHDALKENKDAIVSSTKFIDRPTSSTLFRKSNIIFIAFLDRLSSTQERLFGTILSSIRQELSGRPLQS